MLGGLDFHSIVAAVRRVLGLPVVFNVMRPPFNAIGDGFADDTAPIQAAINAAAAAGRGTIECPGDHLCNTATTASGLSWALSICSSNIKIRGRPGSRIRTTLANTSVMHITGAGKVAGMASWGTNENTSGGLTIYAIAAAAKGDMAVTCTTPAQAGNFVIGDDIFVRSGQQLTIAGSNQPDSEINEVISVNAGTGVIGLKYPLAKPYTAQNYPVGHPNAGTPAPFGVAKITDRTIKHITLADIQIEDTAAVPALIGGQIVDFRIVNVDGVAKSGFHSMGNYRFGHFCGNRIEMDVATNTYAFSTATGTTDVEIADNFISNRSGVPMIHMHEGSARVKVHDNIIQGKTANVADVAISILAGSYDIDVSDNFIAVSGAIGNLIKVDSSAGLGFSGSGHIFNNRLVAPGITGYGIRVADASGWKVGGNTEIGEGTWVESGNTFYPVQRIFLPASAMRNAYFASATAFAIVQSKWPSWTMADAVLNQNVGLEMSIPADWKAFDMYIYWAGNGVNAGNVSWGGSFQQAGAGDLLSAAVTQNYAVVAAVAAQFEVVKTKVTPAARTFFDTLDHSKIQSVWVNRDGTAGADTLIDGVALLGLELVRIK